jgi:hypothetical protein
VRKGGFILVLFPFNLFFSFRLVFHALCLGSEMSKHAASRQGNAKRNGLSLTFSLEDIGMTIAVPILGVRCVPGRYSSDLLAL